MLLKYMFDMAMGSDTWNFYAARYKIYGGYL